MTKAIPDGAALRVVSLSVENVKRIKAVHIVPADDLIQLTGANGAGKSTVLDSIWWAMKGKSVVDPEPIRQGEERAKIVLDLGPIIVTRLFERKEDGEFTTSLRVESDEGALFPSPQKLLDDLLGSLTFDPLEFMEKDAKGQLADLRKLVKLDVDVDLLDGQNAADYERRKEINRVAKERAGRVQTLRLQLVPADELPLVDTAALVQKMAEASKTNQALDAERRARADLERGAAEKRDKAQQRRERAAQLIAEAEALENEAAGIDADLENRPPLEPAVDTSELLAEIQNADAVNTKRRAAAEARQRFETAEKDYEETANQADALTVKIAERTSQKAAAIAAAKMPIDGLGFGDGVVTYKGLPLKQASTGEQWEVALSIAGAMNPKLRVILIRQGGLLDNARIQRIAEWAHARDYQVWMERVEESGTVGIVMEDGAARVAEAA